MKNAAAPCDLAQPRFAGSSILPMNDFNLSGLTSMMALLTDSDCSEVCDKISHLGCCARSLNRYLIMVQCLVVSAFKPVTACAILGAYCVGQWIENCSWHFADRIEINIRGLHQ
jgi:hypothetical protein